MRKKSLRDLGRKLKYSKNDLFFYEKMDAREAYYHAKYIIGGCWPEAEHIIMTSPGLSYRYALFVLKGPWPEAHNIIKRSIHKKDYAQKVLKGPWPEAKIF